MKFTPLEQEEAPAKANFTPLTFTPLEETKAKPPETFVSQVAPPAEPTKPVAASKNVGGPEDLLSGQNYGDDSGAAYVAPAKKPNPLADSVVSKGLMPVGSSKDAGFLPVKPEVLAAFESRYDAATPKQRKILATQPGWMGDIARSRDKESTERDKIYNRLPVTSSVRDRIEDLDPRAEFRKQALVAKGEKPEFAEVAGKKAAAANVPVGREIDFMSAEGLASPSPINEKIAEKFEKANFLERGIEKGRSGMRQQVYGLAKFGAEIVGADEFAGARGLDIEDEAKLQNSIGSNPDYWKNQTENVINSITQQAPTTLLALTGIGTPAAMGIMYVQQFGGAYGESRKLGQDPGEATARAGWMALAEVLGEIPGFGTQLKIMRGALKTAPLESLRQWVVNTAKKEIPGEQFTLAMQTLGDVKGVSPFGTKGTPTIEQYLDQAKDTLVQTVMQSAIMGGGTAAVGKGAQLISGRKPEESQKFKPAQTAEELEISKRVEPTFDERPELTELEAARKPELEGEAAAAPLTGLEAARKPELEVERPTGPLAQLEGARKEEIEQTPVTPVEDPRIATQAAYYTSQGFAEDDALLLAIQDIETATGEKVGQPTGRAMQRSDAADEQRTAEGKAERAALSMEETNVPAEVPARVTEPIPDQYGYEVPSRDEQAAARLEDPFTRGLDNAADLARRSTGREERERTSLEANQKRIQSQISQAFNREAYPDLGILLGANWTRKILTTNPTPEEYQDAAYARMEELGGRLPEDAQLTKETPRVAEAPKAIEAKEERQEAPAAAPAVSEKIAVRQPTAREKNVQNAERTLDLGNGNRVVFSKSDGDVFVLDADNKELAVRPRDPRVGSITNASQFPSFVPVGLRQPLLSYNNAAFKDSKLKNDDTKTALQDATVKLVDAVKKVNGTTEKLAEVKPTAPAVKTVDPLAKFENLRGATRAEAIQGNIGIENKVIAYIEQQGVTEKTADQLRESKKEKARLEALLPEAEKRDNADRNKHVQKQMLGSAKEELDTAVAQGDITSEQAGKLVEAARQTGNAGDASTFIEDALDQNKTPQLAAPKKETKEPAPLEMQRTRKEKLEAETPVPAQPATATKGFAPLELEAARKEELEVEPPAVTAVTKSEAALPKEPKTRKPGGGRKKSELAKTQEQRTKDTNAINQFNRDVITLMGAARKFQQPTGQYPTEQEYDYAESARLRSLEILRKKLYALSLVRDPKAGYIAAKSYIRGLKPGELARVKALHEGTVELTKLPPKPEATLTPTQLEKFRKGEIETMKPRGRPKKVKTAEEKKAEVTKERTVGFAKEGFRPTVRGEIPYTEAEEAELRQLRKESLAPTKSYNELLIKFAKEAGVPEAELQEAADTAQDISEDELNFDDVQKMSVSELTRITQIAARIVETEHSGDADFAFTRLTTLSEALEHIAKTGTALDAGIADALMSGENGKLISKVKLFTANPNTKYSTPEAGKFWHNEMLGAKGLYAPTNKWKSGSVLLAEPGYGHQGINNRTVLHEATHAATVMKISYVEAMVDAGKADELSPKLVDGYRELSKLMDRAAYTYEEQTRRGLSSPEIEGLIDAEVFTDLKEFAAYGLTEPAMKALLHGMPGVNTKKTGFSTFISGVLKILNINPKYESGLKDFILATGKLMEAKTPSAKKMDEVWANRNLNKPLISAMKKAKTQASETKRVMENLAAAEAGSKKLGVLGEAIAVARDPAVAGDILQAGWDNMSIPALQAWLLTMPTDVIVSRGTDIGIGSMKQTYKDIREVGAFRRRESARVENIAKPWIKLSTKEQNKLADVMLASTDLRVDPSKDQSNPTLNKMWNALTPEAKTIYTKTRDYYSTAFKLFNALAMQRIEQSGLKGSIDDPDTPKGRVAQAIRDTYKAGMSIEPYFPLMREGQYWVSFGKKGNYELQTFPTPGARTRFIRERIRENTVKGDSRTFEQLMLSEQADLGNDIKELQEKASAASPMLKKLFDSVDQMEESAMSDMGKDGLKADIFQMHLMSLPEGTFRKQFIHRKNTKGYGRDALKNFVVSGSRIAGQLARAKYTPKIENGISAAKASIKGMPNKDRLGMYVRELELRGKDMVNPPADDSFFNNAVRFANKFIFAYTTTSIKTAVNNTFSFATNSVPTMAKYYGMDATLLEMGKFVGTGAIQVGVTKVKPDGSVTYTWPSLGSSRVVRNSPDLQKAVRRMEELDIVKQNQTFDVYVAKKGAAASKAGLAYDAFIRFTGMPFQGTERIVREVTFLTAFKLGMKQGLDFEAAIDKATMVTDEALFNYDPENMPRAMRNPGVKVLSTLKRFSYFTAIYHWRNAAQMIRPLKGETRRGAAYALFGSMGMTGLVGAGIYQAFGVSTAVGLFGMLQGLWNMINGDGDEDDREDGLLKDLNFQRWFNTVYLPENYGDVEFAGVKLSDVLAKGLLTAASGYDFASGLSQGNLWFKDAPGASGADNAYMNFVESIGFPILSVPTNIASGFKDINEGDTLKGWEKLNPSALTRNPAVAYRYSQEGVLTGMLDTVKYADEFTAMQLFMQGLGYKTSGLAETMDMNFVIKREMARVENVKQDLLKQYYKAEKRGNDDLLDKLDKQIEKFNSMYPADELVITADKLSDYIESQDEALLESERGLEIKEKFQDFDVLRYKGLEQINKEAK